MLRLASLTLTCSLLAPATHAQERLPNLVVIFIDDMAYADIGPFGGDIPTPNLDRLAFDGLRLTNLHTAPSCAPSRAMLLTGVDSHRAGVSNISEAIAPEQRASPFYNGHLNRNVVTIARLLNDSGYHTYLSGKWHLGYEDPALRPIHRGFERTVMMPFSGADNWSDKSYIPHYEKALWFENGEPLELPPVRRRAVARGRGVGARRAVAARGRFRLRLEEEDERRP